MRIKIPNITFSKNKFLRDSILKEFPNTIFNEEGIRYEGSQLIDFIKDADAIIVGLEDMNESILKNAPKLRMISKYGVGIDNIDLKSSNKYGIKIGWTKGLNKQSVAEITLGLILGITRNLFFTSQEFKKRKWIKDGGFELYGKSIGIIGVGNIGGKLIELLSPFNCKIYVNDIENKSHILKEFNVIESSKDEIFKNCQIITIHTPLTKLTQNLFNKQTFLKMRNDSIFINTARGGIVNQADLIWALKNSVIAAAAVDVYDTEPPTNEELYEVENLICTPHIGGNSKEAVINMGLSAIKHLKDFKLKNQ